MLGDTPVRNSIVQDIAAKAEERQTELWIDALKKLYNSIDPWGDEADYLYFVLLAYERLGMIDRAVLEHTLLPFTRPELGKGRFPHYTSWAEVPLRWALETLPAEEAGALLLQVVTSAVANAHEQSKNEGLLLGYALSEAHRFDTEAEVYKVVLAHPMDNEMRASAAGAIGERAESFSEATRNELVKALIVAREEETNWELCREMERALEKLSPGVVATLPSKNWPPGASHSDQIDEMLRRGEISREEWQMMKKAAAEGQ